MVTLLEAAKALVESYDAYKMTPGVYDPTERLIALRAAIEEEERRDDSYISEIEARRLAAISTVAMGYCLRADVDATNFDPNLRTAALFDVIGLRERLEEHRAELEALRALCGEAAELVKPSSGCKCTYCVSWRGMADRLQAAAKET